MPLTVFWAESTKAALTGELERVNSTIEGLTEEIKVRLGRGGQSRAGEDHTLAHDHTLAPSPASHSFIPHRRLRSFPVYLTLCLHSMAARCPFAAASPARCPFAAASPAKGHHLNLNQVLCDERDTVAEQVRRLASLVALVTLDPTPPAPFPPPASARLEP